jgi:hypothetical protein
MACFVIRSSCGILPKVWQPQAVHCASYESFDLCSTTSIVGSLQSGQKVGRISIATSERERLNTVRLARIRKRNNSPSELIPSQTVTAATESGHNHSINRAGIIRFTEWSVPPKRIPVQIMGRDEGSDVHSCGEARNSTSR